MIVCIIFVYNLVSHISLYIIIARNTFCMLWMQIQLPNICPVHKPYSYFNQCSINLSTNRATKPNIWKAMSMHYNQQQIFEDMIASTNTDTDTTLSYVETISNLRKWHNECNHVFRCHPVSDTDTCQTPNTPSIKKCRC